jgi:hypothetical protein
MPLDPPAGGVVLAVDALGVGLGKDVDAVPGSLGDLGSRDAGVEPKRHGGMPEVERDLRQRRFAVAPR